MLRKKNTIYKIMYIYIMYMLQSNIAYICIYTQNKYGKRERNQERVSEHIDKSGKKYNKMLTVVVSQGDDI